MKMSPAVVVLIAALEVLASPARRGWQEVGESGWCERREEARRSSVCIKSRERPKGAGKVCV
jgi:hypothetical protein